MNRALGVHLPLSDAAAEGVTCTVCHLASETGMPPNNGNLALQPAAAVLPESAFGRLSLRSAPDRHKAQVMPATISDAALCGACHNVYTEDGMPLEAHLRRMARQSLSRAGRDLSIVPYARCAGAARRQRPGPRPCRHMAASPVHPARCRIQVTTLPCSRMAAKTSQEESISAEKVTTKKGLKPLDSTAQTAAPSSSAASDEASSPQASAAPVETETVTDSAEMADDVAPSDAATDAAIAPAEETAVTPDEIETETVSPPADETEIESAEITPAEEAVVTPDEIEMETAELPANETDIEPPENTSLVAAVAPPENVSLGTEVSADSNASAADESLNASLNESENATAEDEVAEEDEGEEGNESEEDEPVNRIWREEILQTIPGTGRASPDSSMTWRTMWEQRL